MKDKFVFVDAETDGLYGSFLTVGMIVVNQAGEELDRKYVGISRENMHVSNEWVMENVIPVMGVYEPCQNQEELLESVWTFWQKWSDEAYAVADVAFPVEHRLFEACVRQSPEERSFRAPYPLLDLSSFLWAQGIDPLAERNALLSEPQLRKTHNAIDDVEIAIAIWRKVGRMQNG